MKRIRRRFWTLVISTVAAVVLTAAVASGLFQLAVEAVPGYRAEIERYVRDVTGRPMRIGSLALTWRYYYPSLDLVDVALLDAGGETALLAAERLRIGFSPLRLVTGDVTPDRLELHGLALDLQRDRDGRLQLQGMDQEAQAGDLTEVFRQLAGFSQFRLVRCRLNLRTGQETWSFGIVRADLRHGLAGAELDAELTLPATVGDSLQLRASLGGELLEPAGWSGRWKAQLSGLAAGPWLEPWLAPGTRIELVETHATIEGEIAQGRVRAMDVQLRSGGASAQRALHQAGFAALDLRALLQFSEQGWSAQFMRLQLAGVSGLWSETRLQMAYTETPAGEPGFEMQAGFLRLDDLTPWLQMLREPGALTALQGMGGDLHELSLEARGADADARYQVRARFDGLSRSAAGRAAGFSGASGELAADETGGRVILRERPVALELPGLLVTSNVPFEAIEGEAEWSRRPDGWLLRVPQLRWRLWGTQGRSQFELNLPDDAKRSPEIALTAKFQADDATAVKSLMPRVWGPGLIDWLDRSIVRGRAPSATLTINGPLADFPFANRPGTFSLDVEAKDVLLAYQPDWPPVEGVDATLRFRGNSLTIESTKGSITGNTIRKVSARFPDFSAAELLIAGTVTGEMPDLYAFVAQSPLRDDLGALLSRTTARGSAAVDIQLEIPLRRGRSTQVDGRVRLDGVDLHYRNLPEPIRDLRGELGFGGKRLTARQLSAQWHGLPLDISIAPESGGRSRVSADFRMAVDPSGKGASALIPDWLRSRLHGASDWKAELMIGGRRESPLRLGTDLAGVEVRLPPPLGKPESEPVPVQLTVGEERGTPLRVMLDYQDRLSADLRFSPAGREWTLDAAALRLGAGSAAEAREPGVHLTGSVPELDLRAWAQVLSGIGLDPRKATINGADLHIGRAVWGGHALAETRYRWVPRPKGWALSLSGDGASGELAWSGGQPGVLKARLDHLQLGTVETSEVEDVPLDPGQWPLLDLDIGRLALEQTSFGQVLLSTAPVPHGQRLQSLTVTGGVLTLTGQGEWRRQGGASSARFEFDAGSPDVAALLKAFGYTANLDAKKAGIRGALQWPPAAQGLEWARAEGNLRLDFENGQLRAVEPGAGRVLGLVNFYALPRRLTLNFRDVLSSGLGFDRIEGDFVLAGGHAHTGNLQIVGPSLRMDVRGRIGLVDRDYDQVVKVYPDVSAGVTLGAVLLGGPVAGALALIAQELLEKPLDQITQLSYRVTGSWDNPQVERETAAAPPPASARQPGSPSKN